MNMTQRLLVNSAISVFLGACTQQTLSASDDSQDTVQQMAQASSTQIPSSVKACTLPNTGIVSDVVSNPTEVEITVNLADGFLSPPRSDVYRFRRFNNIGYLFFNSGSAVEVSEQATTAIIQSIEKAKFHRRTSGGPFMAVDGGPYAPRIVLRTEDLDFKFTVSDALNVVSDHSGQGPAISCADYQRIMTEMDRALGTHTTFECASYW